jgi:hypothetical protein
MNRVVQSTEISSRLLPPLKGVGSRREEISVAPNADHGFHRLFKYLMFA